MNQIINFEFYIRVASRRSPSDEDGLIFKFFLIPQSVNAKFSRVFCLGNLSQWFAVRNQLYRRAISPCGQRRGVLKKLALKRTLAKNTKLIASLCPLWLKKSPPSNLPLEKP
jgi:hypothetical protein